MRNILKKELKIEILNCSFGNVKWKFKMLEDRYNVGGALSIARRSASIALKILVIAFL